jgi:hypothetical protein
MIATLRTQVALVREQSTMEQIAARGFISPFRQKYSKRVALGDFSVKDMIRKRWFGMQREGYD